MSIRAGLLLLAACLAACGDASDHLTGYIEAEYVRPAAAAGGRLTVLSVDRGAQVQAGAPLFALDADREKAAVDEARARLDSLQSRLADIGKGGRPEEIAVVRAQLVRAQAQAKLSKATAERQRSLRKENLVSQEAVDAAVTAEQRDNAAVSELKHQLGVVELAGRDDALAAARNDVAAAQAQLAQAEWALAQKTVTAPAAGSVEDVYFRPGEWVNAGVPVLALLPPANRRVRFYVPEKRLAEFAPGQKVTVACDGCGAAIAATVSFAASEAEFAPPVLFDRRQRERLVYRVEAKPAADAAPRLHPGQPVDVSLVPRGG
ncbi:MAG TPA: HlyD family efflux transporter periplasmic adaptor subunit [Nevskiaceae bacterium]|nr:HlyD family efflux transporter periplasmic adaptor subunit [Nevskiaceae bacterium]